MSDTPNYDVPQDVIQHQGQDQGPGGGAAALSDNKNQEQHDNISEQTNTSSLEILIHYNSLTSTNIKTNITTTRKFTLVPGDWLRTDMALSKRWIIVWGIVEGLTIIDCQTLETVRNLGLSKHLTQTVWSHDERMFVVSGTNYVKIYNTDSWELIWEGNNLCELYEMYCYFSFNLNSTKLLIPLRSHIHVLEINREKNEFHLKTNQIELKNVDISTFIWYNNDIVFVVDMIGDFWICDVGTDTSFKYFEQCNCVSIVNNMPIFTDDAIKHIKKALEL
jgi:hypothetical protein